MKRKELKQILLKYYPLATVYSMLNGNRRPNYITAWKMYENDFVPFGLWVDITRHVDIDERWVR